MHQYLKLLQPDIWHIGKLLEIRVRVLCDTHRSAMIHEMDGFNEARMQKMRLWARSGLLRTYRWQFSARYWRLRDLRNRFVFKATTRIFSWRNTASEIGESSSIVGTMMRSVLVKAAFSVLMLSAMAVAERTLAAHSHWVTSSRIFGEITAAFPPLHFDANAYTSLFTTLTGVAGVFLGLYFTAVSTLASSVYSRVPADIRSLLVADKISNVYISLVSYLGVLSLLLLGMQAIGWPAGRLTIATIALLGVVALFSFVKLGMRTFNFYDPPSLATYALKELSDLMLAVSPTGPHSRDLSFQAAYHRRAVHCTDTFTNIVKLSTNDQYQHLRGDSLKQMAQMTLGTLRYYVRIKPHIPTESAWFRSELKQPNWLTTNQMNVDLAVRTGTTLRPRNRQRFALDRKSRRRRRGESSPVPHQQGASHGGNRGDKCDCANDAANGRQLAHRRRYAVAAMP